MLVTVDSRREAHHLPTLSKTFLSNSQVHSLDQMGDEEFWGYASQIAHYTRTTYPSLGDYLTCELQQGSCILPLAVLREVISPPHQFTLLPAAPAWMSGLVAWRGELIGVIDLEAFLSNRPAQLHTNGMLLIAQFEEITLGLYVTAVGSTTMVMTEQMQSPEHVPAWYVPLCSKALKGVYDEMPVLDISAILVNVVQRVQNNDLL